MPLATVNIVKDYPEMKEWVHSMDYKAPFYISSNNYTKIAVDQVQAADQRMHNILLLSTGMVWLLFIVVVDMHALNPFHWRNNGLGVRVITFPLAVCVLFPDTGKIHKVLEAGSEPFIISETQLFSPSTVQSMKLDSKKVHT